MLCPFCKAVNDDTAETCFTCGRGLFALTEGLVVASRYEILSPLGKGGMGMVYRARDRALDEIVALKVLRPDVARSAEMARRFSSEIKLARRVRHKNVCGIHEYGEDGHFRFIAMELIQGVDLRKLLREHGAFAHEQAYAISVQVADGLAAIHEVDVVHRDLKTANIMLDNRGLVRLMDFGIAKQLESEGHNATLTGHILGTPEYMSPEQARGEKVDRRSDIYSLGILIYELFVGDVPFRGDSPLATILKHLQDPPPLEELRAARLPGALVPVLRRALAKNPGERFDSADEMATALREARARTFPGRTSFSGPIPIAVVTATAPNVDTLEQAATLQQTQATPVEAPTPVPASVPTQIPVVSVLPSQVTVADARRTRVAPDLAKAASFPRRHVEEAPPWRRFAAVAAMAAAVIGAGSASWVMLRPGGVVPPAAPASPAASAPPSAATPVETPVAVTTGTALPSLADSPAKRSDAAPVPARPPASPRASERPLLPGPTLPPASTLAASPSAPPPPDPSPPPPSTLLAPPPPSPSAPPTAPSLPVWQTETAVRGAIKDYIAAYASLDRKAIARIYPSVQKQELENLKSFRAYDMEIEVHKVVIDGNRARVECTMKATFKAFTGREHTLPPHKELLVLEYRNGFWARVE